jgi:hypothetical protein
MEWRHPEDFWLVKQLAATIGVSESTVSGWRTGRSLPSRPYVPRLIEALTGEAEELGSWKTALLESYQLAITGADNSAPPQPPQVPEQHRKALTFSIRGKRITFDAHKIDGSRLDQQYLLVYASLKEEIASLLEIIPEQSNWAKELRGILAEYAAIIGDRAEEISRPDAWRLGRKLRKLRSIDRRLRLEPGADHVLPTRVSVGLEEVVVLHNTLSSIDPVLSEYDRRGNDPADRRLALASGQALQVVFATSYETELFEPVVTETLLDLLERDTAQSDDKVRSLALGVDSTRNAIVLLIAEAVKERRESKTKGRQEFRKSFLNASGKIAAGAVAAGSAATATAFVVAYAGDILNFASRIPGGDILETIVHWIIQSAK